MLKNIFSGGHFIYNRKINSIFIFLLPIALFRLADSVLSYVFPIVVELHLSSNLLIGAIMALSSVAGLVCDFLLPQIFPNKSWKFLLISGLLISLLFPLTIILGDIFGLLSIFILSVIIWGVYYELLLFAEQNYVVTEFKRSEYSRTWGVIGTMIDLTGIVGPIVGSLLLIAGAYTYFPISLATYVLALLFTLLLVSKIEPPKKKKRNKSKLKEYMSAIKELRYWGAITKKIIPLLIMAFALELFSATFWIFGGIFGRELIDIPGLDWGVLVLSTIPMLIGSIIVSRLKIEKRKKFISQLSLLAGGLALIPFTFFKGNIPMILFLIFLTSSLLSFSWPMNDAVYSDLQKRLEEKGVHLMGLSNAGYSVAYIIAPILMGYIADLVGFYNAFSILGGFLFVTALLLLIFTPRKLRMPHHELDSIK